MLYLTAHRILCLFAFYLYDVPNGTKIKNVINECPVRGKILVGKIEKNDGVCRQVHNITHSELYSEHSARRRVNQGGKNLIFDFLTLVAKIIIHQDKTLLTLFKLAILQQNILKVNLWINMVYLTAHRILCLSAFYQYDVPNGTKIKNVFHECPVRGKILVGKIEENDGVCRQVHNITHAK